MIDSRPGFIDRPIYNPLTCLWEIPEDIVPDDPTVLWAVCLALMSSIQRDWVALRGERAVEGVSAEDIAADIVADLLQKWRTERVTISQLVGRSRRRVIDLIRKATRHECDHEVIGYLVERNVRQLAQTLRPLS